MEGSVKQSRLQENGQISGSLEKPSNSASGLVRSMIGDDKEAFDSLMERYYAKALHIAYLISGNRADSEDIVQETFIQCWVSRKKIREPEFFETWLFRTLTRQAWRFCKKNRREQPAEELYGEETVSPGDVSEEAVRNWEARQLYAEIKKLPVKQRTVVILYYYNQMSTKEIACVMHCLEGTVKSRLHTARTNLKRVLADEDIAIGREVPL